MRFGIGMRNRFPWDNRAMGKITNHPAFHYFFGRVLRTTFMEWHPRVYSGFLTIAALAIATVISPPAKGAIQLDWSKWQATVEAWSIVLGGLFVCKYVLAQWKEQKKDLAVISGLKNAFHIQANAQQAHRLFEQLTALKCDLDDLAKVDPTSYPLQTETSKMTQWTVPQILRYAFQQRYRAVRGISAAACLDIRRDNKMADPCALYDFPSHFSVEDVKTNITLYMEGLRIYAANADAEVAKLTTSSINHT